MAYQCSQHNNANRSHSATSAPPSDPAEHTDPRAKCSRRCTTSTSSTQQCQQAAAGRPFAFCSLFFVLTQQPSAAPSNRSSQGPSSIADGQILTVWLSSSLVCGGGVLWCETRRLQAFLSATRVGTYERSSSSSGSSTISSGFFRNEKKLVVSACFRRALVTHVY